MAEKYHERLKSPIPRGELERRSRELQKKMKEAGLDCIVAQNITQYLGGCNRWLTDTIAENNYPQSTILPAEGEVQYIACSGPPLDLYPPSHLLRIGRPYAAAPYFSPFNFTHTWEGRFVVQWAKENNAKKIGIAGMEMFFWNYYSYIAENIPGVEIVDASSMFDELRAVKSADEIEFIHKSAALQDKVMGYIPAIAQPGVRCYEIRSKIMQLITDHGGEEMIVMIGHAPAGEKFIPVSSFFQNDKLEKGEQMYVRISSSGPGGLYTTIGRMFSIGCEPTTQMKQNWEKACEAERFLAERLAPGMDTALIYSEYNQYLERKGYEKEQGLFTYGQGYDHMERPSIQPGETMKLEKDMCMAVNVKISDACISCFCAESYLIKPEGAQRLHKTEQIIFRT
ncbi:M24 family metallopeptidase [Lachnospiraceae bacterium 62-35]